MKNISWPINICLKCPPQKLSGSLSYILKIKFNENYLVSEPNYETRKFFTKYLLAIEMRKTQILMNKPVYSGLSILYLGKSVMYEFWYDYVKTKYG